MLVVQIAFAMLLVIPAIWGVRNLFTYRQLESPVGKPHWVSLITSAVMYAIAFNLIFFLQELFLVLGKKFLGLKAYLYHNNHNWEGYHPMEELMQGTGALGIFTVGIICLIAHLYLKPSKSIWRVCLVWLAFHGLAQSLPQITVAYLDPHTDVGEALIGYLQLGQPVLITVALAAIITLAAVNIGLSKIFLTFAPQHLDIANVKARLAYIRFIVVGAALLGSFLVIPFRIPPINQAITPFVVAVFSIPWIWVAGSIAKEIVPISSNINDTFRWSPVVILLLMLLFFQIVLAPGLIL